MQVIDLKRIRESLPNRAIVTLSKAKNGTPFIDIKVVPYLNEEDFEQCKSWQREIIGKDNLSEFYTETTGYHWFIYLKNKPYEFINLEDRDINSFSKLNLIKHGKLIKH